MIFFQIFYKQQGMVGLFSDSWPTELLIRCIGIAILFLIYKLVNHNAHVRESPHTNAFDGCSSVNCIRCNGRIQDDNIKVIVDELNKENHSGLERVNRWYKGLGSKGDHKRQPTVMFFPDIVSNPGIKHDQFFGDIQKLQCNSDTILAEYKKVCDSMTESNGWKSNSTPQGTWNVFYLINQGFEIKMNSKQCPKTMAILQQLDNLMDDCCFGNACFSVVYPNTTISEHYGPCNIRARCHLGLVIPSGFILNVDDIQLRWREGKCLIFDDSYLHRVVHNVEDGESDHNLKRVVFMVDLWHNDLSEIEINALTKLFPASHCDL
ncbi:aspartate beta-hydroxylase domain-containing protein 2-like [Clavelina lepadiformis]|uniref:aspartate beta-hydroxylase domain-containing protein 2-like n=1 Tax=Clavelina lepadiformis TaxID=159417 RepID=UPI004042C9B6